MVVPSAINMRVNAGKKGLAYVIHCPLQKKWNCLILWMWLKSCVFGFF